MLKEFTATKVGLLPPHLAEVLSETNQMRLSLDNWSQQFRNRCVQKTRLKNYCFGQSVSVVIR